MKEIIVKYSNADIKKELEDIGFDRTYLLNVINKYRGQQLKVTNLRPAEANIIKQLCLSLGFDCACSKNTITCECEYTDCLIFASIDGYKKLYNKLLKQPFRLKSIAEEIKAAIDNKIEPLYIRKTILDWKKPYIMGILNVTPDSFSDGGMFFDTKKAVEHAIKLIDDGADIIDIGGESTRPDAIPVASEEEVNRIVPVIKEIRKINSEIPISIDTRHYLTAKKAIDVGADIINDVSGFNIDNDLFDFVTKNNIPSIIMHSDSVPAKSCDFTSSDLVESIYFSLYKKINKMLESGMKKSNIIADTGIGFGKSKETCFEILRRHEEFTSLKVAMLIGISRKSFIKKEFNINNDEADITTALYSTKIKGVNIHRVHNVKLTKKYLYYTNIIS